VYGKKGIAGFLLYMNDRMRAEGEESYRGKIWDQDDYGNGWAVSKLPSFPPYFGRHALLRRFVLATRSVSAIYRQLGGRSLKMKGIETTADLRFSLCILFTTFEGLTSSLETHIFTSRLLARGWWRRNIHAVSQRF
jgi:hypothetical protein